MRISFLNFAPIACIALLAAGCATTPKDDGGPSRIQNQGYSLLHKLMSDESDVGKIFVLKSASPDVTTLVKNIGSSAIAAKQKMEDFAKADPKIEFDVTDLPKIEQDSRDSTASVEAHDLLFSSGDPFQLRLIFTQAQAMSYGQELAKATASHETDPTRKQFLSDLSHQCEDFHTRLMDLLTVKSAVSLSH